MTTAMTEKMIKQKIKGREVAYTVRMYSRMRYYYLHTIDDISVPESDPFPKKQDMDDFIECYNETGDFSLSFRIGFRPEGMSVKEAINRMS